VAAGIRTQVASPYLRRARSVWFVLGVSSLLFFLVCSASGIGLYGYLESVTQAQHAQLQLVRGSQLTILRHRRVDPEAVPEGVIATLNEGDEVNTGSDTEASMTLFDESTVHLYFGAHVTMSTLRTSRFFGNTKDLKLGLGSGTLVISTPDLGSFSSASYVINTPDAQVQIDPNSTVRLQIAGQGEATNTETIVSVGSATVTSAGKSIELQPGYMVVSRSNGEPSATQTAEQDLIRNGDFTMPPTSGRETLEEGGLNTAAWLPIIEPTGAIPPEDRPVQIVTETLSRQSIRAADIQLNQTNGLYARIGLRQEINAPASFFKLIELKVTVKVVGETEPIGGPQGEVFPLTIRLQYTDSQGQQREWKHAFYWAEEKPNSGFATQVPQGDWVAQSFVLKRLERPAVITPTPSASSKGTPTPGPSADNETLIDQDIAVINAIEFYGLGTSFKSKVTDIALVAR
jgi:hypothetical protein